MPMMRTRGRSLLIAGLVAGGVMPTAAMEPGPVVPAPGLFAIEDGAVTLSGGIGVVGLEANEIVYVAPGSSNEISHLIWQSTAPVLTTRLDIRLPEGWTLALDAQVAMAGDSNMEDYDWFGPDFRSYAADQWTHRSQHPETDLDWYFDGSVLIGRDVHVAPGTRVNVNGGLKYTDVRWAAYGGSYVYSDGETDNAGDNFRTYTGDFTEGEPAITYRQQFPALIAGVDFAHVSGDWTFSGTAHAGATFGAMARDDHWMRDLVITDTIGVAPVVAVSGQVEHAFASGMRAFLAGSVEQIFTARADKQWVESGVVVPYSNSTNSGGADLFAATLSVGIKGQF